MIEKHPKPYGFGCFVAYKSEIQVRKGNKRCGHFIHGGGADADILHGHHPFFRFTGIGVMGSRMAITRATSGTSSISRI